MNLKSLLETKTLTCALSDHICDRRSLRDMARQIGICFAVVQCILTNILGMAKVSARYMCPRSQVDRSQKVDQRSEEEQA